MVTPRVVPRVKPRIEANVKLRAEPTFEMKFELITCRELSRESERMVSRTSTQKPSGAVSRYSSRESGLEYML